MPSVPKYKENPFTEDKGIEGKNGITRITTLGFKAFKEESKGLYLFTQKQEKKEIFFDAVAKHVAITLGLKSAGMKTLRVVLWLSQKKRVSEGTMELTQHSLELFLINNDLKISNTTFRRGLQELLQVQVLARTLKRGNFFVNPAFLGKIDQAAFTVLYKKN